MPGCHVASGLTSHHADVAAPSRHPGINDDAKELGDFAENRHKIGRRESARRPDSPEGRERPESANFAFVASSQIPNDRLRGRGCVLPSFVLFVFIVLPPFVRYSVVRTRIVCHPLHVRSQSSRLVTLMRGLALMPYS